MQKIDDADDVLKVTRIIVCVCVCVCRLIGCDTARRTGLCQQFTDANAVRSCDGSGSRQRQNHSSGSCQRSKQPTTVSQSHQSPSVYQRWALITTSKVL